MSFLSATIISAIFTVGMLSRARTPRLELERFPSAGRAVAGLIALILILAVVVFLPLLSFHSGGDTDLDDVGYPTLFLGHALLALFLVVWWGLSGFPPWREFLHVRARSVGRYLGLGLGAGLLGWAITVAVMALVTSAAGLIKPAPETAAEVPDVVRSIVDLSIFKRVGLIVSAMIVEEAFFRSFLQTRSGLLVSSLLFAASHSSYGLPSMLVGVFSVSVVLGLIYRSTDNVLPCMVAHGVFDGLQLLLILPMLVGGS